jgi:hypothetical protein
MWQSTAPAMSWVRRCAATGCCSSGAGQSWLSLGGSGRCSQPHLALAEAHLKDSHSNCLVTKHVMITISVPGLGFEFVLLLWSTPALVLLRTGCQCWICKAMPGLQVARGV